MERGLKLNFVSMAHRRFSRWVVALHTVALVLVRLTLVVAKALQLAQMAAATKLQGAAVN
jgi:hypothetical protein